MKVKYEKISDTWERIEVSNDKMVVWHLFVYNPEYNRRTYRQVKAGCVLRLRKVLNYYHGKGLSPDEVTEEHRLECIKLFSYL